MCMTSLIWILPKTKQLSISILISNQKKRTTNASAFHQKKYKLFKEISNESIEKCGAEIKRFKLQDDSSDLMITAYTAVKKGKLDYESRTL